MEPGPTDETAGRNWRRWRGGAAVVMAVIAVVATVASVTTVWVRNTMLDTDEFVTAVAPLPNQEDVAAALSRLASEQLVTELQLDAILGEQLPGGLAGLAGPLTGGLQTLIDTSINAVIRSEAFADVWEFSTTLAHEAAVKLLRGEDVEDSILVSRDGDVALDLAPFFGLVLMRLSDATGGLLGNFELPTLDDEGSLIDVRAALAQTFGVEISPDFGVIVVYEQDQLEELKAVVRVFDDLVTGIIVVAVIALVGAIALAANRQRMVLAVSLGIAMSMTLVWIFTKPIRRQLTGDVQTDLDERAVEALLDVTFRDLGTVALTVVLVCAVAALTSFLAGPSHWARATRRASAEWLRRIARRSDGDYRPGRFVGFVRRYAAPLLVCGAGAALAALIAISDLSWRRVLIVFVVLVCYTLLVLGVARLGSDHDQLTTKDQP